MVQDNNYHNNSSTPSYHRGHKLFPLRVEPFLLSKIILHFAVNEQYRITFTVNKTLGKISTVNKRTVIQSRTHTLL